MRSKGLEQRLGEPGIGEFEGLLEGVTWSVVMGDSQETHFGWHLH